MTDSILIRREGAVGRLILNRPERLNAFNLDMWENLPGRLDELTSDPDIRVVIVSGAGEKAFGAGADISEFEDNRRDPATAAVYDEANERAFSALRNCARPTIAMIRGFCIGGGCAVALCCDIRVAASDAVFALTPGRLGLGYPFSGIEHAVQELGPASARYLFLTAARVNSDKALELGLIQEACEPDGLESRCDELAAQIAANAPLTLAALKFTIRQGALASAARDMKAVREHIDACFRSEDYREGLAAFREKRAPEFKGR